MEYKANHDIDLEKYLAKPDKSIREHIEELIHALNILEKYNYIEAEIYELVKIACEYHDIGKINEKFQKRVRGILTSMNLEEEMFHNILSLYFLDKQIFDDQKKFYQVAYAIAKHHDYCDVNDTIRNKEELIRSQLQTYNTQPFSKRDARFMEKFADDIDTIKIKGYLNKCDHSASGNYRIEYPADFLQQGLDNMMVKWKQVNPKAEWNVLQKYMVECRDENVIAIAETGMGKTEAGLLWIGDNKGFFFLPLRTAINAIYERIRKNIICDEKKEERVAILHSNSFEYYLSREDHNSIGKRQEELWNYQIRGRQLALPLNISTIDQMFDFVFKYQGFEMKLTTLSYSKVVIDEIQMYSADLLAYLIYGIEQIVAAGGKVAIITATLPPFVKSLLNKNGHIFKDNLFVQDKIRHNIKVLNKKICVKDIYTKFMDNRGSGKSNKILVVCNTVKKAQEIYKEVEEYLADEDVDCLNILHSSYIRKDRAIKETQILEFGRTFDKNGEIDNNTGIWISTSLVEASLDIDFDYLFTELYDLNSLFQRFGRCNRKGMKDISEANCFVYAEIDHRYIKEGNRGFIDKLLYELSREAVLEMGGEVSELEKVNLINKYLTDENVQYSDYMDEFNYVYTNVESLPIHQLSKKDSVLRNILSYDVIPLSIYESNKEEIDMLVGRYNQEQMNMINRSQIKSELYQYTVSIPRYHVEDYKKARRDSESASGPLRFSKFEEIEIIDCHYNELGFIGKKFKKVPYEPEFL